MGRFILRKKQAGRSTQLELVTLEKEGVLKYNKNIFLSVLYTCSALGHENNPQMTASLCQRVVHIYISMFDKSQFSFACPYF